jgi:hypothetical protein
MGKTLLCSGFRMCIASLVIHDISSMSFYIEESVFRIRIMQFFWHFSGTKFDKTLMMEAETISETLEWIAIPTRMIAREDSIAFSAVEPSIIIIIIIITANNKELNYYYYIIHIFVFNCILLCLIFFSFLVSPFRF